MTVNTMPVVFSVDNEQVGICYSTRIIKGKKKLFEGRLVYSEGKHLEISQQRTINNTRT